MLFVSKIYPSTYTPNDSGVEKTRRRDCHVFPAAEVWLPLLVHVHIEVQHRFSVIWAMFEDSICFSSYQIMHLNNS